MMGMPELSVDFIPLLTDSVKFYQKTLGGKCLCVCVRIYIGYIYVGI